MPGSARFPFSPAARRLARRPSASHVAPCAALLLLVAAPSARALPPTATLEATATVEDTPGHVFELTGSDPEDGSDLTAIVSLLINGNPPLWRLYQVAADGTSQGPEIAAVDLPVTVTNAGRLVMFVPGPDFTGTAELFYTVRDSEGLEDSSQVLVDVQPVNDAPVVVIPGSGLQNGYSAGGGLSVAFSDVDGDPLTLTVTQLPDRGSLFFGNPPGAEVTASNDAIAVVGGTQSFWFVKEEPGDPTDFGEPYTSFRWQVSDGLLASPEATATIDVLPASLVPLPGAYPTTLFVSDTADVDVALDPSDPDDPPDALSLLVDGVPAVGELFAVDSVGTEIGPLSPGDELLPTCFLGQCERPLFTLRYRPPPATPLAGLAPTGVSFRIDDAAPENDPFLPVQTITIRFPAGVPVLGPLGGLGLLAGLLAVAGTARARRRSARGRGYARATPREASP